MGTKIAHRMKTLLLGLISLAVLAGLVWGLYTVLANLAAHLMTLNPKRVSQHHSSLRYGVSGDYICAAIQTL